MVEPRQPSSAAPPAPSDRSAACRLRLSKNWMRTQVNMLNDYAALIASHLQGVQGFDEGTVPCVA